MAEAGEIAAFLVKESSLFPAYRNAPAVSYTMSQYVDDADSPMTMYRDPQHYAYMQDLMVSFIPLM